MIARALDLEPFGHAALDPPPAGASGPELGAWQERAWGAIEDLRQRHEQDGAIVVVVPDLPLRLLVSRAIAIPLTELWRFRIDAGSLTAMDFRPQRPLLLASLNETCHLEPLSQQP
jgi:broad specificity phosphatase PhoE